MKYLYYCIWGLWSIIVMLAILFNHCAEFYLDTYHVEVLFHKYNKQWALANAVITLVWVILTWIGLHLLYKNDKQSNL